MPLAVPCGRATALDLCDTPSMPFADVYSVVLAPVGRRGADSLPKSAEDLRAAVHGILHGLGALHEASGPGLHHSTLSVVPCCEELPQGCRTRVRRLLQRGIGLEQLPASHTRGATSELPDPPTAARLPRFQMNRPGSSTAISVGTTSSAPSSRIGHGGTTSSIWSRRAAQGRAESRWPAGRRGRWRRGARPAMVSLLAHLNPWAVVGRGAGGGRQQRTPLDLICSPWGT